MKLSVPDALRAMAWLLEPRHLLAVYAAVVVVLLLALFGAAVLAWLALRRYARALAILMLSTTLTATGPQYPRPLFLASPRRAPFAQHRLVHAAHPPHPRPAAVTTAEALAAQARGAVCAPTLPETGTEQVPSQPPQAAATAGPTGLSEQQLLALANDAVIGPLIDACRQAAGGER